MVFYAERHHRRSIRLLDYDYAANGVYFVTICTAAKECHFGAVVDGAMELSEEGQTARNGWTAIPEHFSQVKLDAFVVMPNHIHGILILTGAMHAARDVAAPPKSGPKPQSIGAIIGSYKSAVTREINQRRKASGQPFWQRNYYEHIVRDNDDYDRIAEYIATNPQRWFDDTLHPQHQSMLDCCANKP